MRKSSESAVEAGVGRDGFVPSPPALEFPVAPGFVSTPPRVEPAAMFRRCEEMLRWRTSRPGFEQRRLAGKCNVEFVL